MSLAIAGATYVRSGLFIDGHNITFAVFSVRLPMGLVLHIATTKCRKWSNPARETETKLHRFQYLESRDFCY